MEESTLKIIGVFMLGAISGWAAKSYSKEIKEAAVDTSIGAAIDKWLNGGSAPREKEEESPEELARKAEEAARKAEREERAVRDTVFRSAKNQVAKIGLESAIGTAYKGENLARVKALIKEGKILAKGQALTSEWETVTLEEARDNDRYLGLIRAIAAFILENS